MDHRVTTGALASSLYVSDYLRLDSKKPQFEMLFGYPCFVAKTRHITRSKILNWRQNLKFPTKPRISWDAQDFIEKLVCEREDRLGSLAITSVSRPNSHVFSQRNSGFFGAQSGTVGSVVTEQLKVRFQRSSLEHAN